MPFKASPIMWTGRVLTGLFALSLLGRSQWRFHQQVDARPFDLLLGRRT